MLIAVMLCLGRVSLHSHVRRWQMHWSAHCTTAVGTPAVQALAVCLHCNQCKQIEHSCICCIDVDLVSSLLAV